MPPMPKKQMYILLLAFLLTAVFYATGFDWSLAFSKDLIQDALLSYALSLLIASLPFFSLYAFIAQENCTPTLRWIGLFILIATPLVMFPLYRMHERSNGWDYLLVPFWQLLFVQLFKTIAQHFPPRK